jgi:hypothetical protein
MQHLVLHIGKKVQKTGPIFTLYFYSIFWIELVGLGASASADSEVASENENLTRSIRPNLKSENFGTGLSDPDCTSSYWTSGDSCPERSRANPIFRQ